MPWSENWKALPGLFLSSRSGMAISHRGQPAPRQTRCARHASINRDNDLQMAVRVGCTYRVAARNSSSDKKVGESWQTESGKHGLLTLAHPQAATHRQAAQLRFKRCECLSAGIEQPRALPGSSRVLQNVMCHASLPPAFLGQLAPAVCIHGLPPEPSGAMWSQTPAMVTIREQHAVSSDQVGIPLDVSYSGQVM